MKKQVAKQAETVKETALEEKENTVPETDLGETEPAEEATPETAEEKTEPTKEAVPETAEEKTEPTEEAAPEAASSNEASAEEEKTAEAEEKSEDGKKAGKSGKRSKKSKGAKGKKGKVKKIALISVASFLSLIILTVGVIFGVGSCHKSEQNPAPEIVTTTRKQTPTDGTTPEDHVALDNIAYMAYVLDNQKSYHAYAKNSTKSTGYEQVTQTWKDYKLTKIDGADRGIMVCSDLSYSALVKSASQTCFVDNTAAYMRTGDKPGKNSVATDIKWSDGQPKKYTRDEYLNVYGEFSTELSVYVINESTVISAGETVNNGDGTYSQTFSLNPGAAYWYQYGMKTRGGLKDYPLFEKIEITFTFDAKWQVLSSYCEEKASISPGALGGFPMGSNSKTTTTFYYGDSDFDTAHFAYFDGYYSQYLDKELIPGPDEGDDISLTDVLMGGFGKVISGSGQQFALSLKLGETDYNGKIYLSLTDLGDVMSTLDVRLSLGKGDGAQDFYAEFRNKEINVYYSDAFALTADINKVAASVNSFSEWIKSLSDEGGEGEPSALAEISEGLDLSSLMSALKESHDETSVKISINSDDLLGLGLGVDLEMNFDRAKVDGINTYAFKDLKLGGLSFKGEEILLGGNILPDDGEIISHNAAQAPASISDYMDGVLALVKSDAYTINFVLDGTAEGIPYIKGLKIDGKATVQPSSDFKSLKVNLPLTVEYGDISAEITAYYTVDFTSGDYGDIYLNMTKLCGKNVEAKVRCDIKDLVASVTKLIDMFSEPKPEEKEETSSEGNDSALSVAKIINTVIKLDFGAIITELKADENEIKVTLNADEILNVILGVLNKQLDIELGSASICVKLADGKVSLEGTLPELGASLKMGAASEGVADIDLGGYADITAYLDGAYELLNGKAISVSLGLDGTCESVPYIKGATANGTALIKLSKDFKTIEVKTDDLVIDYNGLSAKLGLYYTINLSDKTYGKVFVHLTELDKRAVDAKVYCDIKDTVSAVTALINSFKTPNGATPEAYASVVDTVLAIDFGAMITSLNANAEKIELGANVDEVLKALKVNLGFKLGNVNLELSLKDGKANLNGSLPSLGLTLGVGASNGDIVKPNEGEYANITDYVDGVDGLLNAKAIALSLNFYGSKCTALDKTKGTIKEASFYIKDATVNGNAIVKHSKNFKQIEVYIPALTVTYKTLSLVLDINYSIDLDSKDEDSKNYGKVYLNVTEFGGKAVSAKVYCDISETVDAVNALIGTFNTKDDGAPAAVYAESSTGDKIADIIGKIVSIDFYSIINTLTANGTGINASVNADEIVKLLNVNLGGVELGSVSLGVKLVKGNLVLDGALPALGLNLGLTASNADIPTLTDSEYLPVTTYVDGVTALLNSTSMTVGLNFEGSQCTALDNAGKGIDKIAPYIKDVKAETTAQVKFGAGFNSVAVNAPITVTYKNFTVGLEIYYEITFGSGYGNAYVTLNKINKEDFSARVFCNVDEAVATVKELIATFSGNSTPQQQSENEKAGLVVSEIVGKILAIDVTKLISVFTADGTGVNLNVNADEIIDAFKLDLGGVKLGNVIMQLGVDNGGCAYLSGSVPALGLTKLELNGSSKVMPQIDKGAYLNAVELLQLVNKGAEEGKKIAEAKAVEFGIEKFELTVDGVKASVSGSGEVSWADGKTRVALDLSMALSEDGNSENVDIKFVYDEAETAAHLVRVAVNKNVLVIDKSDIEDLKSGFAEIVSVIKSVMGEPQSPAAATYAENGEQPEEDPLTKAIDLILSYASNLTVELKDAVNAGENAVKNLVVTYAGLGTLTLGANGNLSLNLSVKNGETPVADIIASVSVPKTDKFAAVNGELDNTENNYTFYQTAANKQFTQAVYDYVFAVLKDLSVKELLGSDTYTVTVEISGKDSGIKELENVTVNAQIYYTETADGKKLVEIDIDNLTVGGVTVIASASYYDDNLYIILKQIGETRLYETYADDINNKPIMLKAGKDEIYLAVDELVKIITSKNISPILSLIGGNGVATTAEDGGNVTPAKGTELTLNKILNAIFKLAIEFKKEEGENTLNLNIDGLLSGLGVNVAVGDIKVAVNPETHAMSATATKKGSAWFKLNAYPDAESTNGVAPVANEYLDINFVETLLGDLNTTLESLGTKDDGNGEKVTDLRVSLTGELSVNIDYASLIKADVAIKNVVLTVGLDENNDFFFSVKGELQSSSAKLFGAIGVAAVSKQMPISVTYSNGYLTMGRTNDSGEKIYKVMTIEYLIDNMLDKESSPIRWLLGTSSTAWNIIADNVKLPINSGLTDKQEYYLYEHETENPDKDPSESEDKKFVLASVLSGLDVKIGDYSSLFGSAVAKFNGVNDNYYSALVDLSSLLGNSFTPLRAAIVRNENGGLKGLDAYVALKDGNNEVLKVNVNLDKGVITKETENAKHAENFYKTVNEAHDIDYDYYAHTTDKRFGCYSTEGGKYEYSEYNKKYTVEVYDFEEGSDLSTFPVNVKGTNRTHNVKLNSGSTVYMLPEEKWLNEEHTRQLIYVDENGNNLGLTFTVKADIKIYAMIVGKDEVKFFDSFGNDCAVEGGDGNVMSLYSGDALPMPKNLTAENGGVSYTFAGWYTEAECVNRASGVQVGINEYYGKYVRTFVTESNGITYEFVRDAEKFEEGGYYTVKQFNATDVTDGNDYTDSANTLIIANEVNGYKVAAISASAFKATNIKNVIVPENVVTVGAQAFANNKDMQTAVFLAPDVTFLGNAAYDKNNKTATMPFAGCSITGNDQRSNLKVYYKNIYTAEENKFDGKKESGKEFNPGWSLFYWQADNKPRFIGNDGGERIGEVWYQGNKESDKKWAYVVYEVIGDFTAEELGLENYLTQSTVYEGLTADDLVSTINAATESEFINGYTVEIEGEYALVGKVVLTVRICEADRFYKYSFNANTEACTANYSVNSDDAEEYDGALYVKEGATVTLTATAAGSYVFDGWEVNGNAYNENSVIIAGVTVIKAKWSAAYADNVYVSSAVGFVYADESYSAGSRVKLNNAALNEVLATPSANDYTFLGWATAQGEALTVQSNITVQSGADITYYALWVYTREDVEFIRNGSNVSAKVQDGFDGAFYGWYKGNDTSFAGSELAKNADNSFTFTPSNTCVCARLQYSLTVTLDAGNTTWNYKSSEDYNAGLDIKIDTEGGIFNRHYVFKEGIPVTNGKFEVTDVLEGYTVEINKKWTDTVEIIVYNNYVLNNGSPDRSNENVAITYIIKGFKTGSTDMRKVADMYSGNDLHYFAFDGEGWTKNTSVIKEETADTEMRYWYGADCGTAGVNFGTATANRNLSLMLKA